MYISKKLLSKKICIVLVVLLGVLLFSGCNIKEKIGEKIVEGVFEKAVGDEVDLDIDGDEVTYKTEEGEMTFDSENGITFEGEEGKTVIYTDVSEWPEDMAASYLPKIKDAEISYLLNSDKYCMITVDNIDNEKYADYLEKVKDKGYSKDKFESTADDLNMYSGSSEEGVVVTLYYVPSSKSLQLTVEVKTE